MHVKLTRNIGADDLRKFGLIAGGDPEALKAGLANYAKDRVVEVAEHTPFHEYLLKQGLAEATDEVLSPAPVKGVAARPAITAPLKPETFADNPHDQLKKKDKTP